MSERQQDASMRNYLLRFGGEGILIVVSVFVAILLESMWQDYTEELDAWKSLAQVHASLIEDRLFFDRVEVEQKAAAETLLALTEWFADPESMPEDQVHDVLVSYTMPISIWPRRAAWDTMVDAGQLRLLNAPDLATRIGDYYEHHLRRIEYNGRQYDDTFVEIFEGDMPKIWDFRNRRLLTTDPAHLTHFYNRLVQLNAWIDYYLDSVNRNKKLLDELIRDIDQYLQQH